MIVTLLTDFGTADGFVAAMKGVVLSHDPTIRIVDITHGLARHDIEAAAFVLLTTARYFPPGSIHVAVVDPGVGSERLPIVVSADGAHFVGPDNGVFSYVAEDSGGIAVRTIRHPRFFKTPLSSTFHGRDLFAPVAAALATGFPVEEIGPLLAEPRRLQPLANRREADGSVHGRILHIDRFGNCITSLRLEDLEIEGAERRYLLAADRVIEEVRTYFAEGVPGRPFAIGGSAGFLELAVDRGSAAERLGLRRGDPVVIRSA